MPEAIFLSIRRRPADEAGASTRGYIATRDRVHVANLGGAVSLTEAVRLLEREAG